MNLLKTGRKCSVCGVEEGAFGREFPLLEGEVYCGECASKHRREVEAAVDKILITTTSSVDGHRVLKYIDIESVEVVLGTGPFSEFSGQIDDFFGARSTVFEEKLQKAKRAAFRQLKYCAYRSGGNAVIGVDIDYTEFSGNRIGVVANGTVVELEDIRGRLDES